MKERKIECVILFTSAFIYPSLFIGASIYFLWAWRLAFFDSKLRSAIFALIIFNLLLLYPLLKLFINSVKDYRPGNKFIEIRGFELDHLKELVISTVENNRISYEVELDKDPEDSFSEVLYRKEIFTIKLDNGAYLRIKKNRYFNDMDQISRKVWDLQYDATQIKSKVDNDLALLKALTDRLSKID